MNLQLNQEQQELVVKNYKLVHYLVQKLSVPPGNFDDIVSVGTIGLCKAAATFDVSKQIKFATYACRCIHNEILMYFRKNKVQFLSLEDPFATDAEDKELTLIDRLSDPISSNFQEQIENVAIINQALSYVLNCLPHRETIILLFSMADVSQREIAELMGLSQSYISRLEKEFHGKVKNYEHARNYKEVYTVQLNDNHFEISFSTADIKHFNQVFANFLRGISDVQNLQKFTVNCTHERVVIYLPGEVESFAFIARIIQEIENFRMDFSGVSPQSSKKDIVVNTTIKSNSIPNHQSITTTNTPQTELTAKSDKNSSSLIRDYLQTVTSFSFQELKTKFPNLSVPTLRNFIYREMQKGTIASAGRGKYSVT